MVCSMRMFDSSYSAASALSPSRPLLMYYVWDLRRRRRDSIPNIDGLRTCLHDRHMNRWWGVGWANISRKFTNALCVSRISAMECVMIYPS